MKDKGRKKQIALVTYHRAHNCGAMLQAWALKIVLTRMGHEVSIPPLNRVGERSRWISFPWNNGFWLFRLRKLIGIIAHNLFSIGFEDYKRRAYSRFRRTFLPECDDPEAFSWENCDIAVIGSDQVWNNRLSLSDTGLFLGESIPRTVRLVSYAASFGDSPLDEVAQERLLNALKRFTHISVREESAVDVCTKAGFEVTHVADPALLMRADDYSAITKNVSYPQAPYLFLYTGFPTDFIVQTARDLAKRLGVRLVICGVNVQTLYHAPKELGFGISPDKMVALMSHADYVVTTTFHGTVFPILFRKPFLSIRKQVDTSKTRVSTLLDMVGLSDRLATPEMSKDEMYNRLTASVNWDEVETRVDAYRTQSLAFLKEALSC